MSHDTHFLTRLERLEPGQVDWAISLYRNVPLVKEIVETMAPTKDRVAIAVDDTADPAYVLVEKGGRFVTCLGAGMRHDLPVITRAAVEQAAKDRMLLRALLEEEMTQSSRTAFENLLRRLGDSRFLSRESAVELRAWAPIISARLLDHSRVIIEAFWRSRDVLRPIEKIKPRHDRHVRDHWLLGWRLAHLSALCAVGVRGGYAKRAPGEARGQATHFADVCWLPRMAGVALRGMWTVADMAYETIDDQEASYLKVGVGWKAYPAAYTLVMTALRVPALRPRVEKVIARDFVIEEPLLAEDHEHLNRLRDVLAHPEEALLRHLKRARAWADRELPGMVLDDKQVLVASLYARHMLLGREPFNELADMVPFMAASAYEELYLPEDVLATWPSPGMEVEALAYAEAIREDHARSKQPPPPRPPGRNEPCHCGSGRKYKKCHGND